MFPVTTVFNYLTTHEGNSSLVMSSANQMTNTVNTSLYPTLELLPEQQEEEASVMIVVTTVSAIIALLVLLLVLVIVGIIIRKRIQQMSLTRNTNLFNEFSDPCVKGRNVIICML